MNQAAQPEPVAPARPGPRIIVANLLAGGTVAALLGALDGLMAAHRAGMPELTSGGQQATILLAVALVTPLGLLGGALSGAALWVLGRWLSFRGILRWLTTTMGRAAMGALGFGLGAGISWLLSQREIEWQAVDWRGPMMLLGGLAAYAGLAWLLRASRWRVLVPGLVIVAVALTVSTLGFDRTGAAQAQGLARIGQGAALSHLVLRRATTWFDGDGDGYPTALCGEGCDCNDSSPAIHPAALEIPDNGIDEDCSGADMTAAEQERFASVFEGPEPTRRAPRVRAGIPDTSHSISGRPEDAPPGILPGIPGADRGEGGDGEGGAEPEPQPEPPKPLLKLSRPGRPNILLITIDTLRADHMGVYGYHRDTTPRIDAWAENAAVFEQARVTGPSTRFSVVPMLTSKWFTEVRRGRHEWPTIDDEEVLLAERLKELGYTTAAFHSIRYFRRMYNITQGFDHYSVAALDKRGPPLNMTSSDFITDEVLEFADDAGLKDRQPFFLWAYYGDPHSAYVKHPGFKLFGGKYRDTYDHEILFVDHHVGRLLDGLKERGLGDDLIVVLMSDHGEALDPAEDHGVKYHSKNLYDELIHVPLIISGPGIEGRRIRTPVSMIDVVPTLLDAMREPVPDELRGVSLVPWLRGEDPPHPPLFFEKHRKQDDPQKGMLMWPYKVVVTFPGMHTEIYDLAEDPRERENLIRTLPEAERDRLMGIFRHWSTQILRPQEPNYRH